MNEPEALKPPQDSDKPESKDDKNLLKPSLAVYRAGKNLANNIDLEALKKALGK
jgi:hypothetical protein